MKPYLPYRPYQPYLAGSGPTELRASSGLVVDANTVRVQFSACVDISAVTGIQVKIGAAAWEVVAAVASGSEKVWEFTTTTAIAEGDTVEWQYLGGEDSIVDCVEALDVGALEPVSLHIYTTLPSSAAHYNRYDSIIGGQDAMVLVPNTNSAAPYDTRVPTPIILYCHGSGEDEGALLSDTRKATVVAALIEAGYILCGSNAHGNGWGNQASIDDYVALDATVRAGYNVSQILMWGQSMGGLPALNALAKTPIAPAGLLMTYPVCNLANLYALATFTSYINTAYGITGTTPNTYAEKTAGYDPVLDLASVFGNTPMRFYASESDTVVPKDDNTDQFRALVASSRLESAIVLCTGDHGDPTHFQASDYLAFFTRCLAAIETVSGSVLDANTVQVVFSRCADAVSVAGVQININSAGWVGATAVASGSLATWSFTTPTIAEGDSVEWRYVGGTGAIVDCVDSADVGAQAAITLTNTIDFTAPAVSTAEIGTNGANIVTVVFDDDVTSADFAAGWSVEADATPLTVLSVTEAVAGTVQITLAETVISGQTVTLSYSATTGHIEDTSGNPLASITDLAVTNNVSAVSEATYAVLGSVVTVGTQSLSVPGVGIVG